MAKKTLEGKPGMKLIQWWRNRGWQSADESVYRAVHGAYGGSVVTHPDFIVAATGLASVPLAYMVSREQDGSGRPLAAVATWGDYVACTKKAVQHFNVRDRIDLGQSEVILPMAPEYRGTLGYRCEYLSGLHQDNIANARPMPSAIALAKGIMLGGNTISAKSRNSLKRRVKKFASEGGEIVPVTDFSTGTLAEIYRHLFGLRWNKPPMANDNLEAIFCELEKFLAGNVLTINGEPIAVQILYSALSINTLSVEYINGGMSLEHNDYSPGTILHYLNITAAEQKAKEAGVALRYSFGRLDTDYKKRWCDAELALVI